MSRVEWTWMIGLACIVSCGGDLIEFAQLDGIVTDFATEQPVEGVTAIVRDLSGQEMSRGLSDAAGHVRVSPIPKLGSFFLTFGERPGYLPTTFIGYNPYAERIDFTAEQVSVMTVPSGQAIADQYETALAVKGAAPQQFDLSVGGGLVLVGVEAFFVEKDGDDVITRRGRMTLGQATVQLEPIGEETPQVSLLCLAADSPDAVLPPASAEVTALFLDLSCQPDTGLATSSAAGAVGFFHVPPGLSWLAVSVPVEIDGDPKTCIQRFRIYVEEDGVTLLPQLTLDPALTLTFDSGAGPADSTPCFTP